jgi:hypothetical protein
MFQREDLEGACDATHRLLESDLTYYLDPNTVEKSGFFNFKSQVINRMEILHKSYEHFVQEVVVKELAN